MKERKKDAPDIVYHGSLTIYSWGAMLALALVIISYFLHKKFSEEKINPDHLFNLILSLFPF